MLTYKIYLIEKAHKSFSIKLLWAGLLI